MKINELEKIVNDGLVKYKAFKDADDALKQVKGLDQAKNDLGKDVSGLEKQKEKLASEVSKLGDKLKDADKQALEIIDEAKNKSVSIVSKAELDAKLVLDAAYKDVSKHESALEKIKVETKVAEIQLSEINKNLAAAQKEWAATQAKFKAVVSG